MGEAIIGQREVIERLLIGLLANGNLLVEGLPGLAKTRAIKALAKNLECDFSRIQFTPDLLPSDVTGTEVYYQGEKGGAFRFEPGPIFANIVLADEINRAPAKVQAALLEAMEERQVTVAGKTHVMEPLFMVMATQNPIEQEGTYPLPEAQLDRFLLQIDVDYPDRDDEREIVLSTTGATEVQVQPVFDAASLIAAQRLVRRLPVGESVLERILDLVRSARPGTPDAHPAVDLAVSWGPGPRAAQALMLAIRARALIQGRLVPDLDDVAALARPVLIHRMALGFAARAEGQTLDGLISRLVTDVMNVEAAA
ncbi:MAG: MoxR family ATPase [Rhodobacteraceae bacterium]|nr:MoxR family ATPase [Paracoccaceae bacterium]